MAKPHLHLSFDPLMEPASPAERMEAFAGLCPILRDTLQGA